MKQTVKNILAVAALVLLAACAANTPASFGRLVDDVERNAATYTEADWERADERFGEFREKYTYEHLLTLSDEEQREVGRLMARYAKVRLEYAGRQMRSYLGVGANIMQGMVEEMCADSTVGAALEAIPEELESLFEEYEEYFDEYGDFMDD